MFDWVIKNCRIVSAGAPDAGDVAVAGGRIAKIDGQIGGAARREIDARGRMLFPGVIDDQVHFRQPGFEHKANIGSESRAAVKGGVTSFMEMPNTRPPAINAARLKEKLDIAAKDARANYAFYLGATADNVEDIKRAAPQTTAGIKIFMGASTGELLVEEEAALRRIFAASALPIAVHCEDNPRIRARQKSEPRAGNIAAAHARIRDAECCWLASSLAVQLAKETGARLHILHISTAREFSLFAAANDSQNARLPKITCEVCLPHLFFCDEDYELLGGKIKCNPAIKTAADRAAARRALAEGVAAIVATDHAPHLPEEKEGDYENTMAGMPSVEYFLPALLSLAAAGELSAHQAAAASAHRPADLFNIAHRGYIREGFFADLALVDERKGFVAAHDGDRVLSKCGWTPFAGRPFSASVAAVWINGALAYDEEHGVHDEVRGMPLEFAADRREASASPA